MIIPSETLPRSLTRSSFMPPGTTAPGHPTATVAPAPKFHAPQTIWRGSASPTSTLHSCRRSAFGCLPASSTRPTRNLSKLPSESLTPRQETRSTSAVVTARRPASCSGETSSETYSRSHEKGTFISELAREAQVVLPQETDVGDAVAE